MRLTIEMKIGQLNREAEAISSLIVTNQSFKIVVLRIVKEESIESFLLAIYSKTELPAMVIIVTKLQ